MTFFKPSPTTFPEFPCLQTVRSGSALGPGGCTNEILRVCLDCLETFALLISGGFRQSRDSSNRPIDHVGNDDSTPEKGWWRPRQLPRDRLPHDRWPKHWPTNASPHARNDTCAPFQFTLSRRASVDFVGHAARCATDAHLEFKVLFIDGIGAYYQVSPKFHNVEVVGNV